MTVNKLLSNFYDPNPILAFHNIPGGGTMVTGNKERALEELGRKNVMMWEASLTRRGEAQVEIWLYD